MNKELLVVYGESEHHNFRIIDSIGIPHPYCITVKHLKYNSSIYLNIEEAESKGAVCGICKNIHRKHPDKPILSYKEHREALLVECDIEINLDGKTPPELQDYITNIKDIAKKNGYVGFAFIKNKKGEST